LCADAQFIQHVLAIKADGTACANLSNCQISLCGFFEDVFLRVVSDLAFGNDFVGEQSPSDFSTKVFLIGSHDGDFTVGIPHSGRCVAPFAFILNEVM